MRTDVAQLADRVGVGVEAVREIAVFDQPLEEVFEGPGSGWLIDSSLIHIPNEVLQHFTGASQGHFWRNVGDLDRFVDSDSEFLELPGKVFQANDQGLKR